MSAYRDPEIGRWRARCYSDALRDLRDRHPEEFEELLAERLGRPRMKARHGSGVADVEALPLFGGRRELVFAAVLKLGPTSAAEIVRVCNLPASSVDKALMELIEGGWIDQGPGIQTGGGRRSRRSVSPSQKALQWAGQA